MATCWLTTCLPAGVLTGLLTSVLIGCAKHYQVDGMVLRADPLKQTILVSHRDIRGYMPAMVMAFPVRRPAEIATIQPGARVHFRLAVSGHS
ncbi:MAG: copper-binding protein, partial [Acidobacteriota bacterium]|nr:copper-binding protein [Acidobacteriota bacterium]